MHLCSISKQKPLVCADYKVGEDVTHLGDAPVEAAAAPARALCAELEQHHKARAQEHILLPGVKHLLTGMHQRTLSSSHERERRRSLTDA